MNRTGLGVSTAIFAVLAAGSAHADTHSWYLHAGPAQLTLADEATMTVAGSVVPGASYSSDPQWTAVVEIGHMFSEHVGGSLTLGLPPTAKAQASGSIAGAGELGQATYGPVAMTAHWHFNPEGRFSPYVGVGASYMHIFDTKDGLMTQLKVKDDFGPVVQAGFDVKLNDRWGVFFDYKKAWLETEATGNFSGFPASATMTFDPQVLNAGVSYRFGK